MRKALVLAAAALAAAFAVEGAISDPPQHGAGLRFERAGQHATWTTVFKSPLVLEGLTSGADGNLYTTLRTRAPDPCRVIRVSATSTDPTASETVGLVAQPCSPSGLAFGPDGLLYVTGSGAARDQIVRLRPDAASPTTATVFATDVPQANGLAFDRDGSLWATDGSAGVGTVFRVPPSGGAGVAAFRVPSLRNDVTGTARGVGRVASTVNPFTAEAAAPNPQTIVTNGIAFTKRGDLLVADTARGAVWEVELDRNGNVTSRESCDTTYSADTLCLDDVFVQHPYLEGLDGIALDRAGNVWGAANERNAIAVVTGDGSVQEFFRNLPAGPSQLRNGGPLETPTSPVLTGHTLCVAQSDGGRRDNGPNTAGEVAGGGKISCLDQRLDTPGEPLPIR
jgi:sugar lactone lactonase YvrE